MSHEGHKTEWINFLWLILIILGIAYSLKMCSPKNKNKSFFEMVGEDVRKTKRDFDKGYMEDDTLKSDTITIKKSNHEN